MATRQEELDRNTRKVVNAKVEKGKEMEGYQSAEKQLLAIQAEQQQNLAQARSDVQNTMAQNQLLAEAAGVMMSGAAVAQPQVVSQPVNPATQAILSKYGVGQPKFQTNQSHQTSVTKQNVVINNNTTNTTTNNVAVPANIGGPIQGRPIQFRPQQQQDPGQSKMKMWLDNAFNRQNEQAKLKERLFERRDNALTKAGRKILQKLGDLGRTIGERFDPRRANGDLVHQLKVLFFLFGLHLLSKNWRKILEFTKDLSLKTSKFFTWMFGEDGKPSGFISELKYLFGGDRNDDRSLVEIIKDIFWNEDESKPGVFNILLKYFDNIIEDRKSALDKVLNNSKTVTESFSNSLGGGLENLGLDKLFGGVITYLGDILGAIIGGTGHLKTIASREASVSSANTATTDETSNKAVDRFNGSSTIAKDTSSGDLGIHQRGIIKGDVDKEGKLNTNAGQIYGAAWRQGNELIYALNDTKATRTKDIMAGLQRLQGATEKIQNTENKYIILPAEGGSGRGAGDFFAALEKRFGIDPKNPEWQRIKKEAREHGKYKWVIADKTAEDVKIGKDVEDAIKTEQTENLALGAAELTSILNPNIIAKNISLGAGGVITGWKGLKKLVGADAYSKLENSGALNKKVIKIVPASDPRPAINDTINTGYGLDSSLLNRIRTVISSQVGMDNSMSFDAGDTNSVLAVDEKLKQTKAETRMSKFESSANVLKEAKQFNTSPNVTLEGLKRQYENQWRIYKKNKREGKVTSPNDIKDKLTRRYIQAKENEYLKEQQTNAQKRLDQAKKERAELEKKKSSMDDHSYTLEAENLERKIQSAQNDLDNVMSSVVDEAGDSDYISDLQDIQERELEKQKRDDEINTMWNNSALVTSGERFAELADRGTNALANTTGFDFFRTDLQGTYNEQVRGNLLASDAIKDVTFKADTKIAPAQNTPQGLTPTFNVNRAVSWIKSHATPKYTRGVNGNCALGVRRAIAAGFGLNPTPSTTNSGGDNGTRNDIRTYMSGNGPNMVYANQYTEHLGDLGFQALNWTGYKPQIGDVLVYPSYGSHKAGHIAMFGGDTWYADYRHGTMWTGFPKQGVVFRHKSVMNGATSARIGEVGTNSSSQLNTPFRNPEFAGNANAKKAYDFYIQNGMSRMGALGMTAHLMQESQFNPDAFNGTAGGNGAYGIGQWRGSRLKALKAKYGEHPTLDQQLQFSMDELHSTHKEGWRKLNEAQTPDEAVGAALGNYGFSAGLQGAIREMNKYGQDGEGVYQKKLQTVRAMAGGDWSGEQPGGNFFGRVGNMFLDENGNFDFGNFISGLYDGIMNWTSDRANDAKNFYATLTSNQKGVYDHYSGPITSEFKDYNSYLKDSGRVPVGLNREEWEEYVTGATGDKPQYLTIDADAEKRRQDGIIKLHNGQVSKETKDTLAKYTEKSEEKGEGEDEDNNTYVTPSSNLAEVVVTPDTVEPESEVRKVNIEGTGAFSDWKNLAETGEVKSAAEEKDPVIKYMKGTLEPYMAAVLKALGAQYDVAKLGVQTNANVGDGMVQGIRAAMTKNTSTGREKRPNPSLLT